MDDHFLIPIGKRIAKIRRSHKLTQEALADRLGVSPKHISHVECGTSGLSLKNLTEFCNIFGCSMDYLVFGRESSAMLSHLPKEIVDILCTGSKKEIDHLNRCLQMYLELTENPVRE